MSVIGIYVCMRCAKKFEKVFETIDEAKKHIGTHSGNNCNGEVLFLNEKEDESKQEEKRKIERKKRIERELKIEFIKKFIEKIGNVKVAINDPLENLKLKFLKIDLGKDKWEGHIFLNDITKSSKRGESTPITNKYVKGFLLETVVDNDIQECIDRYKRESQEYEMSTHPINFEKIKVATQEEIEKRLILVIWDRQTKHEQETRNTKDLNYVGFSKSDAGFFSHIVKDRLEHGIHLNERELENSKRRLCKYANQLSEADAFVLD